jgi:hypothetical protein
MALPYKNRSEAGRELADALQPYANRPDVLVLALPRGGVPVAYQEAVPNRGGCPGGAAGHGRIATTAG